MNVHLRLKPSAVFLVAVSVTAVVACQAPPQIGPSAADVRAAASNLPGVDDSKVKELEFLAEKLELQGKKLLLPRYVPPGFTYSRFFESDRTPASDFRGGPVVRVVYSINDDAWFEIIHVIPERHVSTQGQARSVSGVEIFLRTASAYHGVRRPDGTVERTVEPGGRFEARLIVANQGVQVTATNGMSSRNRHVFTEAEIERIASSLEEFG